MIHLYRHISCYVWDKCWSARSNLSAVLHSLIVLGRFSSNDWSLVAGASEAEAEWTCFSEKMSHLGLDTLRCLKPTLKCDTPSTYLLAAHNNLSSGCWKGSGGFQKRLQGLIWCGASCFMGSWNSPTHLMVWFWFFSLHQFLLYALRE